MRLLSGEFSTVLGQLAANDVRRRRDPARPRRLVDAARPARARLLVRGRRAARHAHGSHRRADRARDRQRGRRARARRRLPPLRRGAVRAADRARHRPPPRQAAVRAHGRPRRDDQAGDPAPARFGEGHPAKRVFQALRIDVNDELGSLERALPAALQILRPGGRLAVISFHSLEDRIVKRFLRSQEHGCTCPPDFPLCVCGAQPALRAVPRRAIRPSPAEVARNPRAQSARLRVGIKVMTSWFSEAVATPAPRTRTRHRRSPSRRRPRSRGPKAKRRPRTRAGRSSGSCLRDRARGRRVREPRGAAPQPRARQRDEERSKLRAENATLASQLSRSLASPQIQSPARREDGLVDAGPAAHRLHRPR